MSEQHPVTEPILAYGLVGSAGLIIGLGVANLTEIHVIPETIKQRDTLTGQLTADRAIVEKEQSAQRFAEYASAFTSGHNPEQSDERLTEAQSRVTDTEAALQATNNTIHLYEASLALVGAVAVTALQARLRRRWFT